MGSRLEKGSEAVRKRIEGHTFSDEGGEEYGASRFGDHADYMRRKKIKLQNFDHVLRKKNANKPQIFRGIVTHVNGYTQPSLNDIHALVVSHGGGFLQYLDGKTFVTHVIASALTPKKAEEFKRYRVVKPAWIVDSVNAGQLLPWHDYSVVDAGVGQKVLDFDNGQVISKPNHKVKGYRDQTETSWYTSQFRNQANDIPQAPTSAQVTTSNKSASFTQTLTPLDDEIHDSDYERLEDEALRRARVEPDPESASRQLPPHRSPSLDMRMGEAIEGQVLRPVSDTPQSASALLEPPPTPPQTSPAEQSETPVAAAEEETSDRPTPVSEQNGLKRTHSADSMSPRKAAKLSAEEHNSILLADPRIRKSTVVNPDFLEQYYRESRLHHLSTWKADLKSQLQALTAEKSLSQKARQKRPAGMRRYIMHVDFDSFFVAVSLKKCPQNKDKPCVVAHGGGSGSEIASCNYPARKFGITNGSWMRRALELCPDLIILPYDFPAYEDASRKFYDAILETGGIVQSVSIDEALVDISAQCIAAGGTDGVRRSENCTYREEAKADEIAQALRDKVLAMTGCNVSVGIGANILLAKVGLRKAKPAGQHHVKPDAVLNFLGGLEVQALPGVAYSMGSKLEELGIRYVKDIREFSKEKLMTVLGPKTGEKLWEYARGVDRAEVGDQVIRKSVSAEVNWGVRFENETQLDEFLQSLCTELQKRLLKERVKGRQLTLKVMRRSPDAPLDPPKHLGHGKCDTHNKSIQLGVATNDGKLLCKEVTNMMRGFGFSPGELRGIGVQMQKLEPIKTDGPLEGSQRRLHFKKGEVPAAPPPALKQERAEDPIQDDIVTPKHNRVKDSGRLSIPQGLLADSPSKKPLNVMGTQFALPTQVDPRVLAELPEDIRAKLIKQTRPTASGAVSDEDHERRSTSPLRGQQSRDEPVMVGLPNQSQLDADILAALPDDVREEILASYKKPVSHVREQAVLPQSPRKNRVAPPIKQSLTRKRGRGGLFTGGRAGLRSSDTSTLTQSNFVARPQTARQGTPGTDTENETLDPDFLAALPDEIRQEVMEQNRQARLRRTGGIDLSMHQRPRASKGGKAQRETVERLFKLPPRPLAPTFTKERLSKLEDLRGMIKSWVREFLDEAPFGDDVQALSSYLAAVVDDGDIDKAVRVVKWLVWVVENETEGTWEGDEARGRWDGVIGTIKQGVQDAVKHRGLAPVDFA